MIDNKELKKETDYLKTVLYILEKDLRLDKYSDHILLNTFLEYYNFYCKKFLFQPSYASNRLESGKSLLRILYGYLLGLLNYP